MAEAKGNNGVQIRLVGVRHCFTFLYEEHVSKLNGRKTFRDTFLITPGSEQDKSIRAAISQAAKNAWGDKAGVMIKAFQADRTKFPYRDGNSPDNEGNVSPDLEGFWTLTGISKVQPTLKDANNKDIDELGKNAEFLYPGAIVTGVVEIWPQTGQNAGIRCQVQGVRHDRDADPIGGGGGRKARDSEFGEAPGQVDNDDDLVGSQDDDGDIAF